MRKKRCERESTENRIMVRQKRAVLKKKEPLKIEIDEIECIVFTKKEFLNIRDFSFMWTLPHH